jgi:hypothetical protein
MKSKTPPASIPKLNPEWVKQFKDEFTEFLRITKFPEPTRNGTRGSTFDYPESLIMLVAVFSVKCKVKTYQGIHRLVVQYWSILRPKVDLAPISESQLRDRLKKIKHSPRKPAAFIFQLFPETCPPDHRQRR